MSNDTIIALSSGSLPSGVAIIRLSGPQCFYIAELCLDSLPKKRLASLRSILHPETKETLDKGLVLWFPQPNSFTGEDCLELQVHGGRAVVHAILSAITSLDDVRLAQPGEFSRRAFENQKLDLTEIEGIADLVASETEAQRKQALAQSRGDSRETLEGWRKRLIHMRAMIEAELDFSEEEDVPDEISEEGFILVKLLKDEITNHLCDNRAAEIIRDGYKIALMGKPNAGKSSLLNCLAKREVAIVTKEAGTTRDILDVHLDIDGYAVTVSDTAGIRHSSNIVEIEGISRAQAKGSNSDLVIWLSDINDAELYPQLNFSDVVYLKSKDDTAKSIDAMSISVKSHEGIDALLKLIGERISNKIDNREISIISRIRYREALTECVEHLEFVVESGSSDIELKAETLRHASDCIGRITGRIDVEDLLDVIFSEFCVGK